VDAVLRGVDHVAVGAPVLRFDGLEDAAVGTRVRFRLPAA
jgi:hypothetical protein